MSKHPSPQNFLQVIYKVEKMAICFERGLQSDGNHPFLNIILGQNLDCYHNN
jgi:hypothetical protein